MFISADNRILDLDREHIDLAVRYCPESMAPRHAERLFGERLQPVCSPALASDPSRPLKEPQDLARHVLLKLDDDRGRYPWLNWAQWFAAIGIPEPRPAGLVRFNQYDLLVRAAIDGQGVALGRSPLVDQLVAQGQLVALFGGRHVTSRAYFVVRGAQAAQRPEAQAFIDWLRAEAHEESSGIPLSRLPSCNRAVGAHRGRGRKSERAARIAVAFTTGSCVFPALVAHGGRVLDLACGRGRHSRWFARADCDVVAVDRDAAALDELAGLAGVAVRQRRSGSGSLAFRARIRSTPSWSRSTCIARCFPTLLHALTGDGVLLYETFARGNEAYGKPSNPDFLLDEGELLSRVAGAMTVVAFEQGRIDADRPAVVQRLAAVGRRRTWPPQLPLSVFRVRA